MVPAKSYKDRKDIGTQRQASSEFSNQLKRGSAALSAKEAQKKSILERKSQGRERTSAGSSKDKEKAASKLLTKKKNQVCEPKLQTTKVIRIFKR